MQFYNVQLVVSLAVVVAVHAYQRCAKSQVGGDEKAAQDDAATTVGGHGLSLQTTRRIKLRFIVGYILVIAADWLQGAYVYVLYKNEYNFSERAVALLFVVGFASSGLSGYAVGKAADLYGRKRLCILYCVLYAASCLTKLFPAFPVLALGRILGGIATSLLFSVFEAWLVSHVHQAAQPQDTTVVVTTAADGGSGLESPNRTLDTIFVLMSFCNGLVAVVAGVVSNLSAEFFGTYVAPFMVATLVLVLAGSWISAIWDDDRDIAALTGSQTGPSVKITLRQALHTIFRDPRVATIGTVQSLFETCMYLFVFQWSPFLQNLASKDGQPDRLPFGTIFAVLMVSMMLGSMAQPRLVERFGNARTATLLFAVAAFTLFLPAALEGLDRKRLLLIASEHLAFYCFCLFEATVGAYFPTIAALRRDHIADECRATIMGIFRIPLNFLVVTSLIFSGEADGFRSAVLLGCSVVLAASAAIAYRTL